MKVYKILVLVFLMLSQSNMLGQSLPKKSIESDRFTEIPREKLFVHLNTSLFFVGEYMYYRVYNTEAATGNLSRLGKLAYIELVGENNEVIFTQKVRLEDGLGQGDFFIPVSVPSGNYKLVGYTRWMLNFGLTTFFQGDIAIVNPYTSDQKKIVLPELPIDSLGAEQSNGGNNFSDKFQLPEIEESRGISLDVNDNIFKRRSKVSLRFLAQEGLRNTGNYSLSVRKLDTIDAPFRSSASTFFRQEANGDGRQHVFLGDSLYLPELRGELFSGKVTYGDSGLPVANSTVAISLSGSNGVDLRTVATDEGGFFYLSLENNCECEEAKVQILGNSDTLYNVTLWERPKVDYSSLNFGKFTLTPAMKDLIEERSIHNQIEHSHFSIRPDTLRPTQEITPVYSDRLKIYNLDDYTRFSTVRETLVEIIDNVWARKLGKDKYVFHVFEEMDDILMENISLPLVVVDGSLVQDHDALLDYSAYKIKSIGVLREKYILGPHIFQGVIAMETIDNDFVLPTSDFDIFIKELERPTLKKEYYRQVYSDETDEYTDRMLDFRHQLLWIPHVELEEKSTEIDFFTSDVPGTYEINFQGLTVDGEPISIRKFITVE